MGRIAHAQRVVAQTGKTLRRQLIRQITERAMTVHILRSDRSYNDDADATGKRPPWLMQPGEAMLTLRTLQDRKSTRLNSCHVIISYAILCLQKNKDIISF